MINNEIKIIVSGKTMTGKSTITQIISDVLHEKDINCEILNNEMRDPRKDLDKRIESVRNRNINITIEEFNN